MKMRNVVNTLKKFCPSRVYVVVAFFILVVIAAAIAKPPHLLFAHTQEKLSPVTTRAVTEPATSNKDSTANTQSTTSQQDTKETGAVGSSQPSGSKSTAPAHSLMISPSSVTVYTLHGVDNLRPNFTFPQVPIAVSNTDNNATYIPIGDQTTGLMINSASLTKRSVWDMSLNAGFAAPGSVDLHITASAVTGGVTYNGTMHVTILQLPTFSISTDQLYASGPPDSTNFDCGDVNPITYSSNFSTAFMPTMTVNAPAGYSFTVLGFTNLWFQIVSAAAITWGQTININVVVQNQYQQYSIPCRITTGY